MTVLAKESHVFEGGLESIESVAWIALSKAAEKFAKRELLEDGQTSDCWLSVTGNIDNNPVDFQVKGILTVGKCRKQKPAYAPYKNILEYVLCKLNGVTRESILRDLPDEWEQNGKEWQEDVGVQAEIKDMIDRLKDKMEEVPVKGSVTWRGVKV